MTTFRITPMDRTDLIRVDMTPYLELDTRDNSLDIVHIHNSDNAVPASVYYGFVIRWPIPDTTDAKQFSEAVNAGKVDELFARICEGAPSHWDGNNNVCRLTEDAADAVDEVQTLLDGWEDTLPDGGGLWEAGDWFVDGARHIDGLTVSTTDEELTALAESLEQQALADSVVLADTLPCLRRFREELRDSAFESGQYVRCDTCGEWAHYNTLRNDHGDDLGGWVVISEGPTTRCPEHRPADLKPGSYDLLEECAENDR